jgi:hypothetical protein
MYDIIQASFFQDLGKHIPTFQTNTSRVNSSHKEDSINKWKNGELTYISCHLKVIYI